MNWIGPRCCGHHTGQDRAGSSPARSTSSVGHASTGAGQRCMATTVQPAPPQAPDGMGWVKVGSEHTWRQGCGAWAPQAAREEQAQQGTARSFACLVVVVLGVVVVVGRWARWARGACVATPSVRMWLNEHAALPSGFPLGPLEVSLGRDVLNGDGDGDVGGSHSSLPPSPRWRHCTAILGRWIAMIRHLAVVAAITAWVSLVGTHLRPALPWMDRYHGTSVQNSHVCPCAGTKPVPIQSRPVCRIRRWILLRTTH
jgi:hypothetical protein